MSERLESTLLAWPGSTVLQVCRVQSLVLRFDLSALPYLLRLILWVLTERTSLFGRFPGGSDHVGRRRAVSRGSVYSRSEKWVGVRSERRPLLDRPSGRKSGSESKASVAPSLARPFGRRGKSESEASIAPSLARPFGRRGGSESKASIIPSVARPSGRRLDRSSGLPLGT